MDKSRSTAEDDRAGKAVEEESPSRIHPSECEERHVEQHVEPGDRQKGEQEIDYECKDACISGLLSRSGIDLYCCVVGQKRIMD